MSRRTVLVLGLALGAMAWFPAVGRATEMDPSHRIFDKVLKRFVKDGAVNYAALKSDPKDLDRYLDQLSSVPEAEFKKWPVEEQLAFFINLYNASTLRFILDHYPVKSIRKLSNIFFGPWDQPIVRLFGIKTTLNALEHGRLRNNYAEPRIHFALVCAARGCPPLRSEAYHADRLNEQLEDQGRKFLSSQGKNFVDSQKRLLYLSPIFRWYADDFVKKYGSVKVFVQPYFPSQMSSELSKAGYKIRYTSYDWSLNDSNQAAGK